MLLEGRKALVTGASSGIGRATAARLAQEGAGVCVNYYSSHEQGGRGGRRRRDRAGGRARVRRAGRRRGRGAGRPARLAGHRQARGLNLLVNSAGIQKEVPLLELSLADWDAVIRTNLTGAFLCLREVGRVMAGAAGGWS